MLIDAHAYLDRYGDSLTPALEEIASHRIFTVSNSMDIPSYERNLEIAQTCELVLPTFGVHPWNAPEYVDRLDQIPGFIEQNPILGEIGLDYHFVEEDGYYPAQREVFDFFLVAAAKQDKIVNLHTKGAEEDVLQLLKRHHVQRAIVHWYSGPLDVFRMFVSLGVYFTIGVEVLYSEHIQRIAREVPAERLLTETDNPGGPEWLTGGPGMPLLIRDIIESLARLRKTTASMLTQTVQSNFARLVQGDPWLSAGHARMIREQTGDS